MRTFYKAQRLPVDGEGMSIGCDNTVDTSQSLTNGS